VRESDIIGWYRHGEVLGVIFTEISSDGDRPISEVIRSKILRTLSENLEAAITDKLVVSVHLFPENWDQDQIDPSVDHKLYPDISANGAGKNVSRILKRGIDIIGSLALLLLLSPVLAAIALAIKLTSKGSAIFRQERLGQFGKSFHCLKFRTMYADNDPKIHQEYVQSFIAGKVSEKEREGAEGVVYKIKNDPRVTPVGRLLRRASLDELPQFWNVLRGEMSLVGPRPPLAYEFAAYDLWHRRRVLEVKPGVTGLWQVAGRSRTSFDEMVRMDLRYCQRWSIWLDLKILLATPAAVVKGSGAY
jgi:exopolysaccharide biosynthesis polyprenyl glycosylphosphotransferase